MLKIVKKLFGRSALPHAPSWWGLLPLPKNPTPLSAFGLDFWPFWPHWAASPKSLHFPQCIRVLIKKLVVPIFGAKECIRRQELLLKIYKKFRGSWPPGPGPPRREGDICSHPRPCPPAKCWCPSASSRLATALLRMMSRDSMFLSYLPHASAVQRLC